MKLPLILSTCAPPDVFAVWNTWMSDAVNFSEALETQPILRTYCMVGGHGSCLETSGSDTQWMSGKEMRQQ